jgi:hypothetical protein
LEDIHFQQGQTEGLCYFIFFLISRTDGRIVYLTSTARTAEIIEEIGGGKEIPPPFNSPKGSS